MGKSCKSAAQSLVDCVKNSQCVKEGGTLRECIKKPGELDSGECKEVSMAYFICKKQGLDMRTRIQGEKVY